MWRSFILIMPRTVVDASHASREEKVALSMSSEAAAGNGAATRAREGGGSPTRVVMWSSWTLLVIKLGDRPRGNHSTRPPWPDLLHIIGEKKMAPLFLPRQRPLLCDQVFDRPVLCAPFSSP